MEKPGNYHKIPSNKRYSEMRENYEAYSNSLLALSEEKKKVTIMHLICSSSSSSSYARALAADSYARAAAAEKIFL